MPRFGPHTPTRHNFNVPLPEEIYQALRAESERTGRPASALARAAITHWLEARRQARVTPGDSGETAEAHG